MEKKLERKREEKKNTMSVDMHLVCSVNSLVSSIHEVKMLFIFMHLQWQWNIRIPNSVSNICTIHMSSVASCLFKRKKS